MRSAFQATAAQAAPGRTEQPGVKPWRLTVVLLATAAALAGFALSPALGEPDSARFVFGLWRWTQWGPAAGHIYDLSFSAGYYALFGGLSHGLGLGPARMVELLKLASAAGYVAMALLAYEIGRLWLEPRLAAWAALAWILSPGVWWLGLEAHPQAPATAMLLLALWLWARAWEIGGQEQVLGRSETAGALAAGLAALVAALLLRADAVLAFPAFFALAMLSVRCAPARTRRLALGWSLAFAAAACLVYAGIKRLLLGPLPGVEQHLAQKTVGYILHGLSLLGPRYILKQLAPMALSPGLGLSVLAGIGVVWLWSEWRAGRKRGTETAGDRATALWWLLAAWSLPMYLFWFLVLGNNARHLALAFLPVLWAGGEGARRGLGAWRRRRQTIPARGFARPRRVGAFSMLLGAWLLASGLDAFLPPASADLNLLVSANVPASAMHLRRAEAGIQRAALRLQRLAARDAASANEAARPCFLGTPATDPYILAGLLLAGTRFERRMPGSNLVNWIYLSPETNGGAVAAAPASFRIYEIYGAWQYRQIQKSAQPPCRPIVSLEYTSAGSYRAYLGRRVRRLALGGLKIMRLR